MLLSVNHLRKQYLRGGKTPFWAVDGVSLNMAPGEFVSIIGRSGSGKTTLLSMIAGLLTPTSGEILFNGINPHQLSDAALSSLRNEHLGCLPQGYSLLPNLTALDNVSLPFYLQKRAGRCAARARGLLAEVGLAGLEDAYPAEMSGGEMLRAAIARALINEPRLLIADEPTSDLDADTAAEIMELLLRVNRQGTALLIVTHDLGITRFSSRVYRLASGKLRESEPEI